jgi:hypothetical protein
MRHLNSLLRNPQFSYVLSVLYALARVSASVGQTVGVFPDSASYTRLSFTGNAERMWPIPAVFSFLHSDSTRILANIFIGSAVWIFMAFTLARQSRYPRAVFASVLLLGLSPQVIRYDLALLSESLGISFAVLLVVTSVRIAKEKTTPNLVLWMIAFVLCSMTRPTHLIIVVACALVSVSVLVQSRARRAVIATPALILMFVWGYASVNNNRSVSNLNMYTVLMDQILRNDSQYNWFVAHGMPEIAGIRDVEGYDYVGTLPLELVNIIELSPDQAPPAIVRHGGTVLATWVKDDGWGTYARWMASHPNDVLQLVQQRTNFTLSPPNDDFLPLHAKNIIPRWLFGSWIIWSTLGCGAMGLLLLQPATRNIGKTLVFMSAITFAVFVASVTTSGIEHQRHSVTVAVIIRVLALCAIVSVMPKRFIRKPSESDALPVQ